MVRPERREAVVSEPATLRRRCFVSKVRFPEMWGGVTY